MLAQRSFELAAKEEIRHGEFKRQPKHILQKRAPLQVDDDRGVGDEDAQGSGGPLIQAFFQLANRYAEEFRGPRLADHLLGQRAVA